MVRPHTSAINYFLAFLTALTIGCDQREQQKEETRVARRSADEPAGQRETATVDKSVLAGVWVRTDAPYQIKINEALDDGRLKAGYYNPKSIHVGKAEWTRSAEGLAVYLELRDDNYPGSNYTLIYVPERDALGGVYFQAVEGATYDVVFTRAQ
jgi:hypothetical protein